MITDGQARVQQIIHSQLVKYEDYYPFEDGIVVKKIWGDIWPETLERLGRHPDIITDRITSTDLNRSSVSEHYVRWLEQISRCETVGALSAVKIDMFIYDPPFFGKGYTGGSKPDTVIKALFSLAAKERGLTEFLPIPMEDMEVKYFSGPGILTNGSGGRHRLLAHVLWGDPNINAEVLYVYHDDSLHDPELNKSLLLLESIPGIEVTKLLPLQSVHDSEIDRTNLIRAAKSVKKLVNLVYPEYLQVLYEYYHTAACYRFGQSLPAEAILELYYDMLSFVDMGKIRYGLFKIHRFLHGEPQETTFEKFLSDNNIRELNLTV
jgi:hypothetical protein